MDKLDRKILYALDRDSRASFAEIGKAVRQSPETVRYRVQRLTEQGIISHFTTIINPTVLGYSYYEIYLRLRKVDGKQRDTLVDFLAAHPKIAWVGNFEGVFDIGFIVMVRNHGELATIFAQLHERFGPVIMRKRISINVRGEFLPRDYLIDEKRAVPAKLKYEASSQRVVLDEKDLTICRLLAEDARMTALAIGQRIGITGEAVIVRKRRLKERGVVGGHIIVLANERMQQLHYKVLLSLTDSSEESARAVVGYLKQQNRVFAIVTILGEWDYEIDLEVDSVEQVRAILLDLTNKHAERIKDYDLIRVLDMPKFNFFPGQKD